MGGPASHDAGLAQAPAGSVRTLPERVALAGLEEPAVAIVTASAANVAVLKGNRGKLTSVQLPSGKPIASFSSGSYADRGASLSPNGRLVALPVSNTGLKVLDSETGTVLWTTETYTDLHAWLPEAQALLLSQRGNGAPRLLDLRSGRAEPYSVPLQRLAWAVPMPGPAGRLVVGERRAAAIAEHSRASDGTLSVQMVRQWTLEGQGATATAPFVMTSGRKLIYLSGMDLGWLDLETGAKGVWTFSALGGHGYAKLDENTLYLDVRTPGVGSEGRLFDVEQASLRPAEGTSNEGLLLPLGGRDGFARRGHATMVIGSRVQPQGEPQPVDALIAQAQLAQQLAKLNVNAEQVAPTLPPQERARHLEDLLRRTTSERTTAVTPAGRPMLSGEVPAEAKVAMIGVYEPASTMRRPDGSRGGSIRVTVVPGKTPLVLVLSSYESVNWVIQDPSRRVSAVLHSGYNASQVVGAADATRVVKIGSGYAYKMDSPQYEQVRREVARYIANPVQSFQGGYKGQDFVVH